jgi:hypothetical protein
MREYQEIFDEIESIRERYKVQKLSFISDQAEMLRDISCCYDELTDHKSYQRERWMAVYNLTTGSVAAKERFADTQVPEYDKVKDKLSSCKMLKESLVSTLSANKNG